MSAIDLSMIIVDTGNSIGSAARPNTPPTAPLPATSTRCNPFLFGTRRCVSTLATAASKAAIKDLSVAR
jgi:hypothetical protein